MTKRERSDTMIDAHPIMYEALDLAGLTPRAFLRRHWQKKPLLARGALPQCAGIVHPETFFALAGRDEVHLHPARGLGLGGLVVADERGLLVLGEVNAAVLGDQDTAIACGGCDDGGDGGDEVTEY